MFRSGFFDVPQAAVDITQGVNLVHTEPDQKKVKKFNLFEWLKTSK